MKRTLASCIFALLLVVTAVPSYGLVQSPVPPDTPDPFVLPVNLRIIRIREGNGFDFLRVPPGLLLRVNSYLVDDGQVTTPVPASIRETYAALRIEDMYVAYVLLAPQDAPLSSHMIPVDIRLLTFPDGDAAAAMVETSLDVLAELGQNDPNASRDVLPIDDLPEHNETISGVTGIDPLVSASAGGQSPIGMPFTRFFAQDGAIVASVKVGSMDPAFNDAVARELLTAQLDCLSENVFCQPIPLPAGVPLNQAPPGGTPAAVTPERRSHEVACRVL